MRALFAVFLLFSSFFLVAQDPRRTGSGLGSPDEEEIRPAAPDSIRIIGTGDIMLGTNYPSAVYLPPGEDCSPLLRPVHQSFSRATSCSETWKVYSAMKGGTPKKCKDTTRCYVFRMPDHFAYCLLEAGYDVLSVANNHVNDFGSEGRRATAALARFPGICLCRIRYASVDHL